MNDDFTAAKKLYHSTRDQISDDLLGKILNFTIWQNNMPFFKFLVAECKIDPEKNWFGHGPLLHFVTSYGWMAGIQYLIENRKCNPEIKDQYGYTPLVTAIYNDADLTMIQYFIETIHCTPDFLRPDGRTLLSCAASSDMTSVELLEYFIHSCNIDIDAQDNHGYTAIYYAAINGHVEEVEYLAKQGASLNLTNCDGERMLTVLKDMCRRIYEKHAGDCGDHITPEIINLLKQYGAIDDV